LLINQIYEVVLTHKSRKYRSVAFETVQIGMTTACVGNEFKE